MIGTGGRRKLLVLTQYYRPEPNFITADVAEAMQGDFAVTVVTAHPNYPTSHFYPGHRRLHPTCTHENGVTVWRLPLLPYHGNSVLRRGVAYLSFVVGAAALAPLVAGRPDAVWVYQTPFTTALAALWFRLALGAGLVYTYADLWPESLVATSVVQAGPLVSGLYAYRRWINRRADAIIASTRGTARQFETEGVPADRLHYIPVWVEGAEVPVADAPSDPDASIVYAGNLGPAQRVDTLVRAAARLREELPGVTVDIYGTGALEEDLRGLAAAVGATNVRFHGRVAPTAALAVSRRALAQVVSLVRTPAFEMTVPSKLAFCCAAGAPVLAGLSGEAADLAAESGGAIAFDSDDPAALVAAVRRVVALSPAERAAMSARLRAFHASRFAREQLLGQYRAILGAIGRGESRGRRAKRVSSPLATG